MARKKVGPRRLWDYGFRWVSKIQNRTSNTARGLNGRCPLKKITGESIDITEYLDFGFYGRVWFKENHGGKMARCIPPSWSTNVLLGLDQGGTGTLQDHGPDNHQPRAANRGEDIKVQRI